ncbi:MAG: hypothetical protein RIS80_538 [Actinomycetota bacterium]
MSDLRSRIKPKRKALKVTFGVALLVGLGLIFFDLAGIASSRAVIATEQLLPGDHLTASNTKLVEADLGQATKSYLDVATWRAALSGDLDERSGSWSVVRPIGAGEYVARSGLTSAASLELAAVAIEFETPLPANITAGSRVDLFATRLLASNQIGEPQMIAAGAWVRSVRIEDSVGRNIQVVELAVNRLYLPEVLASTARSDFLALVASSDVG